MLSFLFLIQILILIFINQIYCENIILKQGQPYKFTNKNYPDFVTDQTLEYNFSTENNGQIKIVCDEIKMEQNSPWSEDCQNVYIIAIDEINERKLCYNLIDNFVQKSNSPELLVKIFTNNKSKVSFSCTALNNAEPKAEVVELSPNGKAIMIGELPEPIPHYDHVWVFNSPKGTRMSFQCVTGMTGISPVCGKNVFTINDGEQVKEYCESDYIVLFSKKNKARVRVQLDEEGDGYFECIVQAVTGPNVNEYENAASEEVDSSEHGVVSGEKKTTCKCGWANKITGRIINGTETRVNEFPWMVYLSITNEAGELSWDSSCGASIITPRHVLSAAHCLVIGKEVVNPENVKLIMGRHNNEISTQHEQIVTGQEIFIDNLFLENGISYYDIAIILTKERIKYNSLIGPVCLEREELPIINRRIIIMGWGLTEDGKPSNYLRKSKARVMDPTVCGGNPWDVCTVTSPSGTCSGDSGGPLVWLHPETNRYTQISLVSRGHDDCKSTASLSTLIAYFYDWIQDIIKRTDPTVATCHKK